MAIDRLRPYLTDDGEQTGIRDGLVAETLSGAFVPGASTVMLMWMSFKK